MPWPKFYMLKPCLQCSGIGGGNTGGRLVCDGRALIKWISAFIKEVQERCSVLSLARSMDRVVNPQQKASLPAPYICVCMYGFVLDEKKNSPPFHVFSVVTGKAKMEAQYFFAPCLCLFAQRWLFWPCNGGIE